MITKISLKIRQKAPRRKSCFFSALIPTDCQFRHARIIDFTEFLGFLPLHVSVVGWGHPLKGTVSRTNIHHILFNKAFFLHCTRQLPNHYPCRCFQTLWCQRILHQSPIRIKDTYGFQEGRGAQATFPARSVETT